MTATDSRSGDGEVLFYLFETTTHVLWAEEVAAEGGLAVDVVPAPERSGDLCGLALQVLPGSARALEAILSQEGIPFHRHPPRAAGPEPEPLG